MKRSIIKKYESISVTCQSGNFSNNLLGRFWEYETEEDHVSISVDMSGNLSRTSKDSNGYYDALELLRTHTDLKMVQIFSDRVVDRVAMILTGVCIYSRRLMNRGVLTASLHIRGQCNGLQYRDNVRI